MKGLDLVNRMLEELRTEVLNTVQGEANKTIPKRKKSKKAKWLSERLHKELEREEKRRAREKGKGTAN